MSVLSLIPEEKKKCSQSSESVYSANSLKFPCALHKRKILHPLLSSTTMISVANNSNRSSDKFITKRVLSAKEHRVKQLQNQLADAHFHLSELSNENRLLRSLQKRQDSALQRYENANGDIPKLINSHTEEIRSWQVRFKQLKLQFRAVAQKLKDKEFELQQLNDEHKHLRLLSKDANLMEREKLQNQVEELQEKVQKQNEMISSLQRRINLEAKNFKHQLHAEMLKHKETQQQLNEAVNHSDQLSSMIEMKEKMIAASAPKKTLSKLILSNSKTSLNLLNLDSRSKQNILPPNLSAKGNSSSDSQTSSESFPKTSRSSKSLFSVVGKSVQNNEALENNTTSNKTFDNEAANRKNSRTGQESDTFENLHSDYDIVKAIRDGMPSVKIFESDTDGPRSSDEEVRDRVEGMKKQLRHIGYDSDTSFEGHERNATYREVKKVSQRQISVTSEESTGREQSNVHGRHSNRSTKQKENKDNMEASKNAEDSEIDMNTKTLQEITKTLNEFDENILDMVNETFSYRDISTNSSMNPSVSNSDAVLDVDENTISRKNSTELNNNCLTERKVASDLNEEKKKKLLAALKAIDRGEDDGMHFEALKKNKSRSKPLNNNSVKRIFN